MEISSSRFILSVWGFIAIAALSVLCIRPINSNIARFDRKEDFVDRLNEKILESNVALRNAGFFGDEDPKKLRFVKQSFFDLWLKYKNLAWTHDVIDNDNGFDDYTYQAQTMISSIGTLSIMGLNRENAEVEKYFNKTFNHPKGSTCLSDYFGHVIEAFESAYEITKCTTYSNNVQGYLPQLNGSAYDGTDVLTVKDKLLVPSGNPIFNIHEFSSIIFSCLQIFKTTLTKSYFYQSLKTLDKIIQSRPNGLHQNLFNYNTTSEVFGILSFDSNGYSIYETMLKACLLTRGSLPSVQKHVNNALEIFIQNFVEIRGDCAYIIRYNETIRENIVTLDSFLLAGLLKLHRNIHPNDIYRYGQIADKLVNGLLEYLKINENGLPPRTARLDGDRLIAEDNVYDLSHRFLETLLIFYRSTHEMKFRDAAWRIFKAVNESCTTEYGYCPVKIEPDGSTKQLHKEVSPTVFSGFFKLMYLMFSDSSIIDLDNWIISPAGHPLKVWSSSNTFIDAEVFAAASRMNVF